MNSKAINYMTKPSPDCSDEGFNYNEFVIYFLIIRIVLEFCP